MYNQSQGDENWQRQARENGWTPPEPEEEKDPAGIGGFQKFVLLILAVIVLSTWLGRRKEMLMPTKSENMMTNEKIVSFIRITAGII